jgi:hypothetical protein
MDQLKEMLKQDPCYEQHIVAIRTIYEEYLFGLLAPFIFEGFMSMYKDSLKIEGLYATASTKNPNIKNPGVFSLFRKALRNIPDLNAHQIKKETDRIRAGSKASDIFDDLIRAVIRSNIILLTYNVDHRRKDLIESKYHENIIIHDFVHTCYIQASKIFHRCPELFGHEFEPIELNKNKRECIAHITEAIKQAIRMALPMKEILLEYLTQKYEQKDPFIHNHNKSDQYMDINAIIERDIADAGIDIGKSLLEDDDLFEPEKMQNIINIPQNIINIPQNNLSNVQNNDKTFESLLEGREIFEANKQNIKTTGDDFEAIIDKTGDVPKHLSEQSDTGVKMVDIAGLLKLKGANSSLLRDIMPEIQKGYEQYKKNRVEKKLSSNGNDQNQAEQVLTNGMVNGMMNDVKPDVKDDMIKTFSKSDQHNEKEFDGIEITRSDRNKTKIDSDRNKTKIDSDRNKTKIDSDRNKTKIDSDRNKTKTDIAENIVDQILM